MFPQAPLCSVCPSREGGTGIRAYGEGWGHRASGVCERGSPNCPGDEAGWLCQAIWRLQDHIEPSYGGGQLPVTRIEDIFPSLADGKTFSKLDLAHAYQQLPLDEKSKSYVVINTHKGLYRFNRLPFGVSSAPAIFQRMIESILGELPHVSVYLDDILVTGESEAVLQRLESAGLRLKSGLQDFRGRSASIS